MLLFGRILDAFNRGMLRVLFSFFHRNELPISGIPTNFVCLGLFCHVNPLEIVLRGEKISPLRVMSGLHPNRPRFEPVIPSEYRTPFRVTHARKIRVFPAFLAMLHHLNLELIFLSLDKKMAECYFGHLLVLVSRLPSRYHSGTTL